MTNFAWRSRAGALVIALGLALSLAGLGIAAMRDRDAEYFETTSLLRQLHEVDARSEAQVLRALTGIDVNYDALTSSLSETARLSSLIEERISTQAPVADARLPRAAADLRELESRKSEAIEQFKSANSVLRNSRAFLPTAEADFRQASDAATVGTPGASARIALEDAHGALVAILSRTGKGSTADDAALDAMLAGLKRDAAALPADATRVLDVFLAHAAAVITAQRRVDGLVGAITKLATSRRIDAIGDLLGTAQKAHSAGRLAMRNVSLAFAALMLSLFILSAVRLARAHATLGSVNGQLKEVNETLEMRVAQRTSELSDANMIVRNSATILYRIAATPALPLTYVSPNIVRFGLEASTLLEDRQWAARIIAPEDLEAVVVSIRGFVEGDSDESSIEHRVLESFAPTRWVENRCSRVRDASGQVVEIEGIVFDVTARKEAQLALKKSEEFTRAILDSISVEVAVLDSRGVITAVNEPWRRFSRLNALDAGQAAAHVDVGSNYLGDDGLEPAGEGASAYEGIRAVLAGTLDRFDEEYPCHAPDRERWFSMSVTPLGSAANGVVVTHEDITERKRTEAALRASEHLLDRAGEIGGIGGWKYDLATQAIEWTAQTARIHGVDPGGTLSLAEAIAFYPPHSRAILETAIVDSARTGRGYDVEVELLTADGRLVWVRTVSEVEFVDGRAVRMSGTFQDVTARRQMEQALRRNAELLATALETLPCGICVFNADGKLVAWNSEYVRLLALPPDLFATGAPSLEAVTRYLAAQGEYGPGDAEVLASAVVRQVTTAETHCVERVRPDGSTLEIRGALMPGGGVVATFNDISARRRAEASAQDSMRLLSNAIETIDEAFVLFGPDGRLIFCNQIYRDLFGPLAPMVVAGATFDDLALISGSSGVFTAPADAIAAHLDARDVAAGIEPQARLRRLVDGRVLRVVSKSMPDGHRVGIWADVSELLRASELAQQALLAKGQFLANISHEIRTPMNAILGLLALLQRTELAERQRDYVARTDGAARALLGVLNAVLDFSKIEAGAMRLDLHPFDMEGLMRELALIVSANVGRKALELRFDIDPALPRALIGDATRLQQVLVNLMGNAVKFSQDGFVELAMRVLADDDESVSVEIVVRDTGIGIAPENQQRIFSGFTQAESSITRRFGGTGLGLAISHHLVGLMGSVLSVESAVGVGSAFRFAVEFGIPPGPALVDDPPVHERALRVLIIADDMAAGACCARMGRSLGWTVEFVLDGEEALHELQRSHSSRDFDLAVIDCSSTGSISRELHRHVGDRLFLGLLPIVLLGSLHERERVWARDVSGQRARERYLVKPFTGAMLDEAVQDLRDETSRDVAPDSPSEPPPRRLAGLRILVVEDNPTNQLIARELLESEGAAIAIAADGAQAVRALPRGPAAFDVVLMDLQMPVMDGFTAARRIRDVQGHVALPIIAMTANASPDDRQDCLAAGMNEHIGKPFDLNALVALLRKTSGRLPVEPSAAMRPETSPRLVAMAGRAGVDLTASLARLNGNAKLYAQLLAVFVEKLVSTQAQLEDCADRRDLVAAAGVLHTTRGLAGTLGVVPLVDAVASAEAACRDDADALAGPRAIRACCSALANARAGLVALLAACESAAPRPAGAVAPADLPEVLSQLERIVQRLRESDMETIALVATLVGKVGGAFGGELATLDDLVGTLQFERAAGLCDELIDRLRSG